MNSKNLTLEEYNKILKFYNKKRPQSIYKLKKQANYIMNEMMCKTKPTNKKYNKIINIIKNKNIHSHNKKNLKHGTMKIRFYNVNNNTRSTSPIYYYLCI